MLAFGRLTIPERVVARVTWSISEFYTLQISLQWLKIESSNFVQELPQEILVVWWQTIPQAGVVTVTWRLTFLAN